MTGFYITVSIHSDFCGIMHAESYCHDWLVILAEPSLVLLVTPVLFPCRAKMSAVKMCLWLFFFC